MQVKTTVLNRSQKHRLWAAKMHGNRPWVVDAIFEEAKRISFQKLDSAPWLGGMLLIAPTKALVKAKLGQLPGNHLKNEFRIFNFHHTSAPAAAPARASCTSRPTCRVFSIICFGLNVSYVKAQPASPRPLDGCGLIGLGV